MSALMKLRGARDAMARSIACMCWSSEGDEWVESMIRQDECSGSAHASIEADLIGSRRWSYMIQFDEFTELCKQVRTLELQLVAGLVT